MRSPTRPPGLQTKRLPHEFQYSNQITEAASHFFLLQLSLWNHHVKILPWPIIITVSSLSLHISQAAPLTVWSCWRDLPRQILSVFNSSLFSRLSWPLPTTYSVIITINSMLLLGILVGPLYRLQLTSTFFFFSDQCSSVSSPAGRATPRKNKNLYPPLERWYLWHYITHWWWQKRLSFPKVQSCTTAHGKLSLPSVLMQQTTFLNCSREIYKCHVNRKKLL
jgi:hypothetical protein